MEDDAGGASATAFEAVEVAGFVVGKRKVVAGLVAQACFNAGKS